MTASTIHTTSAAVGGLVVMRKGGEVLLMVRFDRVVMGAAMPTWLTLMTLLAPVMLLKVQLSTVKLLPLRRSGPTALAKVLLLMVRPVSPAPVAVVLTPMAPSEDRLASVPVMLP